MTSFFSLPKQPVQMLRLALLRRTALAIVLLLSGCSGSTGSESPTTATPVVEVPPAAELTLREALQQRADQAVAAGIPSVSLYYSKGPSRDDIAVQAGTVAIDTVVPVDAQSRYQIASNGKMFTSIVVQRLAEQGVLDLTDAVALWLEPALLELVPQVGGVTLRMLLGHTSGIPDYLQELAYLEEFADSPDRRWQLGEVLRHITDTPATGIPGGTYAYSNTNYALLGAVIEQATDMSLAQALRYWVIDPAGLSNTYATNEMLGQPPLVSGYYDQSDQEIFSQLPDLANANPWSAHHWFADAPVQSTPEDMVLFLRELFTGENLLSEASKNVMTQPAIAGSDYGLGVIIANTNDRGVAYLHGGAIWGFLSQMLHIPQTDQTVAVVASGEGGELSVLFSALMGDVQQMLADYGPD